MQKIGENGFWLFLMAAVMACVACNQDSGSGGWKPDSELPIGDAAYNTKFRTFPNAPAPGAVTYEYFNTNAPVSYWNTQGHNHKYPDLFRFMNGSAVQNIADWEKRRAEISLMLQYYMHGRMPSIADDVLEIEWEDDDNTCTINLKHIESNRTATITVTHTPPAGAVADAQDKILMFGVGGAPNRDRHSGWGVAAFTPTWGGGIGGWAGGGTPAREGGTCAPLYGFSGSNGDTPSYRMQHAWAMSVILTVIKEGGFNGYYDPDKVGIYGFSTYGKSAMIIGAFAEGREGNKIGQTFIGSAGSGGPSLDRFIAQVAYKNFAEDPLPVDATTANPGAKSWNDINGNSIIWYQQKLNDTPAASNNNRGVVRGWTADTPGIPEGALIYNETVDYTVKPYLHKSKGTVTDSLGIRDDFGGIQNLAQARGEAPGWFSQRFGSFIDQHNGLDLDHDFGQTGRGKEGVLCTMPFDAHFISALIAPRIVYYEDGYDTTRNNTEAQWANWLICDEIYQMYAEEKNDPMIIWRNAIKIYHLPHAHQAYQDQDEYDLTTAIYAGAQPNAKFRMPPFPVDDPRYRWDFNRMDFGRPGHPTIAERVWNMRNSGEKVKAMDTRGLLDNPENL